MHGEGIDQEDEDLKMKRSTCQNGQGLLRFTF